MSGSTSFTRRHIDVSFQLGNGNSFAESSGSDTVTLSGLRCSVAVEQQGGISQGQLDMRVYGLTESKMNQLTQVQGAPIIVPPGNTVTVMAGTDTSGMSVVYKGTISGGFADYAAAPDVPFHVLGLMALLPAVKSVPPSSYKGAADVATIMGDLAQTMGFQFSNSGVSGVVLSNPYFPGTAYQQAEACAAAAGIDWTIDSGVLAIWPRNSSRSSGSGDVPLISPETGLIGYPMQTLTGIRLETLFNPAIRFGGTVQVQSSRQPACGKWKVQALSHLLESETPDGSWLSRLTLVPVTFF